MSPPLKVLFIAGFGRSGTTILDSILGQIEGYTSVGESQYLWDRSLVDNRYCGCGARFRECELWGPVAETVLADLSSSELDAMVALRDSLGPRRLRALARVGRTASPNVGAYVDRLRAVYTSVAERTGARVIVDSSKAPSHGWLVEQAPELELHVLHVVRDPRAVAFSWRKRIVYDDSGEEPMFMARLSWRQSSRHWREWNRAIDCLWGGSSRNYQRLRYEDFVARPRTEVRAIVDAIGEPGELAFVDDRTVELAPVHSVAGNPNRFQAGPITIEGDEAWRAELSAPARSIVSLLTWPLRRRYGY